MSWAGELRPNGSRGWHRGFRGFHRSWRRAVLSRVCSRLLVRGYGSDWYVGASAWVALGGRVAWERRHVDLGESDGVTPGRECVEI